MWADQQRRSQVLRRVRIRSSGDLRELQCEQRAWREVLWRVREPAGCGRDRSQPGDRYPLAPSDRSLRIHACHSPTRELEGLRDQLLDLFDQTPDLQPWEVVVLAPNVDAYAPAIEAVFGASAGDEGKAIPSSRILIRTPDDQMWLVLGTDSSGNFSIRGLPQGQYVLQMVVPGEGRSEFSSISPSVTVGLGAGEHARKDLVARPE